MLIDLIKNTVDSMNNDPQNINAFYFYGDWKQYSNYLTNELKKDKHLRERFPGIFLPLDYEENENEPENSISSFNIIIIEKTEEQNNQDRFNKEVSILKKIKDAFIYHLKLKSVDFDYSFELFLDAELNINNMTNILRLTINDLSYENDC